MDITQLNKDGFFPADDRNMGEPFEPHEGQDALGITIKQRSSHFRRSQSADEENSNPRGADPPGFMEQTKLLFGREFKNLKRDVAALGARFGLTIFLSVLIGIIFLDVGETDSSKTSNLQSHFGALIMVSHDFDFSQHTHTNQFELTHFFFTVKLGFAHEYVWNCATSPHQLPK